jgi:hypothetical protein
MRIILGQRHMFNKSKPMCQLGEEWVQWDNCDLSESPPYRLTGTMNAHGKFPKYNYDELPIVFTSSDGKEYPIDEIKAYKDS